MVILGSTICYNSKPCSIDEAFVVRDGVHSKRLWGQQRQRHDPFMSRPERASAATLAVRPHVPECRAIA